MGAMAKAARAAALCLATLAGAGTLLWVGRLPDLPPPRPPRVSDADLAAERARATIAPDSQGSGRWEIPAIHLLDHLQTAERVHPDLTAAQRSLPLAKGGPGHWRHYVDPWSRLPVELRPLRMQMTFSSHDVNLYAKTDPDSLSKRRRHQFGSDRSMDRTPGVNKMRLSLFAPVPSSFTFRVVLPKQAFLSFGAGVPMNGPQGPVTFLVEIAPAMEGATGGEGGEGGQANGSEAETGRGTGNAMGHMSSPGNGVAVVTKVTLGSQDRHQWHDRRVDLSAWGGKEVRITLRSQGAKGAFAFFSNPVVWKAKASHKGKNILFVLVDTLRADAVKSVSGEHPVTPHMDALAEGGAVFTRCSSMASWTRSSMLGMFTGEHISRMDPQLNTTFWLPEAFRQRMYRRWPRLLTWHLREQGYWLEAIGNNFFLPGYTPIGFDRAFDHVTDVRATIHDTPAITRGAVRFLESNRDRPFFLYLHYDGPHQPYVVPTGYAVKGARAPGSPNDAVWEVYLGETRWTDEHLGPIFETIRRLDLAKDTLVVVTADHGEVFHPAHDVIYGDNNRTLHAHGWSLFEEVLHVPLILSLPGVIPAGTRVEDPVSHLDLVPTLLALAGLPPMAGHGGQSLVPSLLRGEPPARQEIAAIGRNLFSLRQGSWKYIYRDHLTRSFRRQKALDKRIYWMEDLYDLAKDPQETQNLAKVHPERARQMRERLLALVLQGDRPGEASTEDPLGAEGLRVSLRLWGGQGPHRLRGDLRCPGHVVVRSLRGSRSHTTYQGQGAVTVSLESLNGRPAEVELELVGCEPASVAFALTLDGAPVKAEQISVGPIGLELMSSPTALPLSHLPALVSSRPPPLLPSETPRLHLWLGSSFAGEVDPGEQMGEAAKLADQMLRDAGYSRGPGQPGQPPPTRPEGGPRTQKGER